MTKRTPIIGGNWKMNTELESGMRLASSLVDGLENCCCDVVVYPPTPFLQAVESVVGESNIQLGAQNAWHEKSGAFTGETSPSMLGDLGVNSILIGHSERRHLFNESNETIAKKMEFVVQAGFQAVLCVGETLQERECGSTMDVVLSQITSGLERVTEAQMGQVVVAYEPVWAIGTGKTASPEDAQEVHSAIRATLAEMFTPEIADQTRIQYGGSVKPDNAATLFSCTDIDGALVGGASLTADSFIAIVKAACTE